MTIHVIPIEVISGETKNYSYIVCQSGSLEALIIDPAWEAQKYEHIISRNHLRPTDILLTHAHADHTDLAPHFARAYHAKVWISDIESKHYHFDCPNLHFIEDKKGLSYGNMEVIPFLTPGHTIGSVCYLIEDSLFTGDTLFIEGCGMCFEEGADPGELYKSIMLLKEQIQPHVKIYPGHRYGLPPGLHFSFVKKHNVYFHFKDKETFINFRMRPNQSNWFNYT